MKHQPTTHRSGPSSNKIRPQLGVRLNKLVTAHLRCRDPISTLTHADRGIPRMSSMAQERSISLPSKLQQASSMKEIRYWMLQETSSSSSDTFHSSSSLYLFEAATSFHALHALARLHSQQDVHLSTDQKSSVMVSLACDHDLLRTRMCDMQTLLVFLTACI